MSRPNEIHQIAYTLNAEGKVPSVALIRARLSKPTALPMIIQGLQQWKANPELGKEIQPDSAPQTEQAQPQSKDKGDIEQRLDIIEEKLDRILALLEQGKRHD